MTEKIEGFTPREARAICTALLNGHVKQLTPGTVNGVAETFVTLYAENERLRARVEKLEETVRAFVEWDDAEKSAPTYASDGGAHFAMRTNLCRVAFERARAALSEGGGE